MASCAPCSFINPAEVVEQVEFLVLLMGISMILFFFYYSITKWIMTRTSNALYIYFFSSEYFDKKSTNCTHPHKKNKIRLK